MRGKRLRQITGYALARPEAYLIVGLVFVAVVVAIVGGWPGWIIAASVVVGALLLALLVVDTLGDPDVEPNAAIADVDLGQLRDPALRSKVNRALEYVRAAQKLAKRDAGGALDPAGDEIPDLAQAVRSIFQVSLRLQEFRGDRLIQRDLADLRQQSQRDQLTKDQQAQWSTLQRLQELMHTAEQEIDSALADLGRSYAEMQAIKATPELRGRAADALDQLQASTKRLSTLAAGYDEAFGSRALPGGS